MIIMALDHSRDFFALGFVFSNPLNLDFTNFEVFMLLKDVAKMNWPF